MAYTTENFPSKKALKEAFKLGKRITVFQPGPFGPSVEDGRVLLEGPHYPEAHRWYAMVDVLRGRVVKIY